MSSPSHFSNCSVTLGLASASVVLTVRKKPDGTLDAAHSVDLDTPYGKMIHYIWRFLTKGNVKIVIVEPKDGEVLGQRLYNGSYTGILGLVQRGEAETALIPVVLNTPNPIWTRHLRFFDGDVRTACIIPDAKLYDLDISNSLATYDRTCWLIILLLFLLFAVIFCIVSRKGLGWSLSSAFASMTGQYTIDAKSQIPRAIILMFLALILFVSTSFNAGFLGSLVVGGSVFTIETLSDFFRPEGMEYQPAWFGSFDIHTNWATSRSPLERAVWQRAVDNKFQKNFIKVAPGGLAKFSHGKVAAIGLKFQLRSLQRLLCTFGLPLRIGKYSLDTVPVGMIMRLRNDSCSHYKETKMNAKHQELLSSGVYSLLLRMVMTVKLNEFNHWQCTYPENPFKDHKHDPIRFSNVKRTLAFLVLMLAAACCLLGAENVAYVLRKRQSIHTNG